MKSLKPWSGGGEERETEPEVRVRSAEERSGTMYCAYTIPGVTGSPLMYYYNGKAVRKVSGVLRERVIFTHREGEESRAERLFSRSGGAFEAVRRNRCCRSSELNENYRIF